MNRCYKPGVGVLFLALFSTFSALAGSDSWTNNTGAGYWTNNPSWLGGSVPNAAGDIAYLTNNITANRTITNDTAITIGHLWIGDATGASIFTVATFNAQSLTFNNSGLGASINKTRGGADIIAQNVVLADNLTITNSAGFGTNLTFNGTISGVDRSLTKAGAGWVILNNTNTYTGSTIVNNGVLRLMDSQWINQSSNLVINGGVLEIVSNDFASVRNGGLGTGSNQIQILSGRSGFSINGNANRNIRITGTTGTMLQWGSTYFQPTVFVLNTTNANRELTFLNALDLNGAVRTIEVDANMAHLSQIVTNTSGTAAGLIKIGAGVLDLNGVSVYNGTTTVSEGALRISSPAGAPTNSNLILNGGVLEFGVNHSWQTNMTLGAGPGQIQMAGSAGFGAVSAQRTVNLNGDAGLLTWGGTGSLSNLTALVFNTTGGAGGTISIANGFDFNGSSRTVTVNNGYGRILGPVTNTDPFLAAGLIKTGANTLWITGNNYQYDGSTFFANGIVQLGDFWNAAADSALPGLAGNAGNVSNNATIMVANQGSMAISGAISGTGALTMNGRGLLTLTGTNGYSGITTLNRGSMLLDFSAPNAPATNIVGSLSGLVLGNTSFSGGMLTMKAAATGTNLQTFKSLAVNNGVSALVADSSLGGVMNVMISNVTRAAGGTVDFTLPGNGAIQAVATNFHGILGGYATIGGTDWATSLGAALPYRITNYTGYVVPSGVGPTIAHGSNQNIKVDATSSGDLALGAPTTGINTLLNADASGIRTIANAGNILRLGTTGGILQPASAAGLRIGSAVNDGFLTAGTNANVAGELIFINNSINPITVNAAVVSNGTAATAVTVAGSGPVVFAGTNMMGGLFVTGGSATFSNSASIGAIAMTGGALNFNAGGNASTAASVAQNGGVVSVNSPLTVAGEYQMSGALGGRAVLVITTNLTTTRLRAAVNTENGLGAGAIFQTGGLVFGTVKDNGISVSDGIGNYGYYRLMGGSVTGDVIGAFRGFAVVDIGSGGTVMPNNIFRIVNDQSGIASFNVWEGGAINAPGTNTTAIIQFNSANYAGSVSVLNLLGGVVDGTFGGTNKAIDLMSNIGNTSFLNLDAGVVTAHQIKATQANGLSVLNFNGGTLSGRNSTLSNSFVSGLTAAYVYSRGAIIDLPQTNSTLTITTSLLAPDGYGLASIATNASCGGQYIGSPFVRIAGGSGTGALAVAEVDFATGSITNFAIVNAGTGYQAADVLTVTLEGGGPLVSPSTFTVSGASLTANDTTGGLTKLGQGVLVLSNANTYAGATLVGGGVLAVGHGSALGSAAAGTVVSNGATLDIRGGLLNIAEPISIIGQGLYAGFGVIRNVSGTNTLSGGITLLADSRMDANAASMVVFDVPSGPAIGGDFELTLGGAGSWTMADPLVTPNNVLVKSDGGTLYLLATNNITSLQLNNGVAEFSLLGSLGTNRLMRVGNTANNTTLRYVGADDMDMSGRVTHLYGGTAGGTHTFQNNGTGAWTLGDIYATNGVARTLILSGTNTGANIVAGAITETNAGSAISLTKSGAGTWTLGSANAYSGGTLVNGGTLVVGAAGAIPTATILTLGDATGAGTLALSNYSASVTRLLSTSTNTTLTSGLFIGAGQSLTVNGNVTNGLITDNTFTRLAVSGAGTFTVTNAGGAFQVGANSNGLAAVNMSALSTFNAGLGAGTFRVGGKIGSTGTSSNFLQLATNSTITASVVGLGDQLGATAGLNSLKLGAGATALYADNLFVGGSKTSAEMLFDGPTGTLTVSNRTGAGRANLSVGDCWTGTGSSQTGLLDLRGHEVSLFLGAVTNGGRTGGLSGNATGRIFFDSGTLDASSMIVGLREGTSYGSVTGEVHIGGGTAYLGPVELARNSVISNNAVIALLNIYGGSVLMSGAITKGGGVGAATARLLMTNSATLDMNGYAIGSGANQLDTLQLDSGTLRNMGEINGGAAWTKGGSGTLTIEGANTYSGNLTVSGGTLRYNGSYTGGGLITVQNGATIMGTGTVAALMLEAGATVKPGNSAGTLTVGDLTLDGGATLEFELGLVSDLIVANTAVLGGIEFPDFTFVPGPGFAPGSYTLINATGISGLGAVTNGTVGAYSATLSINTADQDLVLTVVPEPGSMGLIGMIAAAALLRRRLRNG